MFKKHIVFFVVMLISTFLKPAFATIIYDYNNCVSSCSSNYDCEVIDSTTVFYGWADTNGDYIEDIDNYDGTAVAQCKTGKFAVIVKTTESNETFLFYITAKGNFTVDYGNGYIQTINKNTGLTTYKNTANPYAVAGIYPVVFDGTASGYASSSAFSLSGNRKTIGIYGSLGAIFPTLGDTTGLQHDSAALRAIQPQFSSAFQNNINIKTPIPKNLFTGVVGIPVDNMFHGLFSMSDTGASIIDTNIDDPNNPGQKYAIPPTLFAGISGPPSVEMFRYAFYNNRSLTGTIPPILFSGVRGTPANGMFYSTFSYCTKLTGSIPENLFSGISGSPARNMFINTFFRTKLTGSIPANLFAGIRGVPAFNMFEGTFAHCSGLTGTDIDDPDNPGIKYAIPPTLFAGISGAPDGEMFENTFYDCSGLTGSIPAELFSGISGAPQSKMFYRTFYGCSRLTGVLPDNLFAGISGTPAINMFFQTFYGCSGLTGNIPIKFFGNIHGKPAENMFYQTFRNCTNISGTVPPELFAGIDNSVTATDEMYQIFNNSGISMTCPSGTTQYITGFESYWANRKSCTSCPVAYPDYNTDTQQCYAQVSYMDSDDNTLLKTEDIFYDANNPNGFTLPSYSPTKPDTILDNWTTGDGTVIGSADLLTGNQVVYSDWGFHCDSGHYFHAGNEQICTAETKRTTHALVIKPDANHTYYIHATPNSEHDYTINSSSIHKMKVNYNGTIYNLHDASVYFSD